MTAEMQLTFREMADASTSQASYRGLTDPPFRPEADVRTSFWWQVRGLWREGHLPSLAGVLALDGAALLAKTLYPDAGVPYAVFLLPLATVGWLAISVRGSWRAWRLARVARTEPAQPMRYVLLHSYASEAPWLVFFSPDGEDSADPLGALPLRYGPLRDRFRDLPGPVGEAALSGETTTGSTVVPWIGGRPVWPAAPYRETNLDDPDYLRSLSELVRPE